MPQRETVPDEVVRRADQVELVDMTPEALRRRMAHGNIYPPEKVDAALGNYFRVGNLTALRELALLWLADKVDEQLDRYRAEHGITGTWEARERVVVALTGGPEGDTLIRRGRPHRRPDQGRRPARRARRPQRRPRRRPTPATWPGSGSWWKAWAAPTTRSSATTSPPRCWTSPAASTPPSSCSGASRRGRLAQLFSPRGRRHHHRRLRADRRAPGHPRGGQPGGDAAARPRRRACPAPAAAGSCAGGRAACRC